MSRNQTLEKQQLIERLLKTPIIELACKQTGIARATYYRWTKSDPAFATACNEAIEQSSMLVNDMAESQLISAIKDKNMVAIQFWLRHHHTRYETRIRVDANLKHETSELNSEQAEIVGRALRIGGLLSDE